MVVLIGKSGVGKDFVLDILKRDYGFTPIVSYTTRPMRDNEIDGINYHFVNQKKFQQLASLGFFAEKIQNYGCENWYGVAKEDCLNNSIVIVEKEGLKQLKTIDQLEITSICLYNSPIVRGFRMLKRGDSLSSVLERLYKDKNKFKNVENDSIIKFKVRNGNDTALAISETMKNRELIKSVLKTLKINSEGSLYE